LKALVLRYARALLEVALEHEAAEKLKGELGAFAGLLEQSSDLRNFLASPAVSRESKQAVVEKLVARLGASKTLRNFLFVVVENRRSSLLPQIQQAYGEELDVRRGIARAQVTSARELTAQEQADLGRVLERITGKRVEARYGTDPGLIGGAVVRIGSTVYDGSVRQQLNRLRARLAAE